MPYYQNLIYYLYIPKTGGSVIENEIKEKERQKLWSGLHNILDEPHNKQSLNTNFIELFIKIEIF